MPAQDGDVTRIVIKSLDLAATQDSLCSQTQPSIGAVFVAHVRWSGSVVGVGYRIYCYYGAQE
jgi:hypothetical protein